MRLGTLSLNSGKQSLAIVLALLVSVSVAYAKDIEYKDSEITVHVNPGEPTSVQFPAAVAGGFRKKLSAISIDKKDSDLIIFANESLADNGEALIVRLADGRSYSIRVARSGGDTPRDDVVRILDGRGSALATEEEDPAYKEKSFDYAPPSQVAGLMREMSLVAEFGKSGIAGYKMSDRYAGQSVLDDGTIKATIDKIFIGQNLWGYVITAQNQLDETQKINPATFRIDGTRAVSANSWELAPKPLNVEQQIAGKDKAKIYVITRAKGSSR